MILKPNSDITIYNKYYDPKDDIEKYQRTVIKNVNWQNKVEGAITNKGVTLANSTLIFIDVLKKYISPKQFKKLSDENRQGYFTLNVGDKIVKGNVDFVVTGIRPNSIANLEENYDDVVSILTVSEFSTHFEVGCK